MKLTINLRASRTSDTIALTEDNVDFELSEWNGFSEEMKEKIIRDYIDAENENGNRPYWEDDGSVFEED